MVSTRLKACSSRLAGSRFVHLQAGIELDRKILSELAIYEPQSFTVCAQRSPSFELEILPRSQRLSQAVVDAAKETATPLTKNALNLVPMKTVEPVLLAAITNATRNNPKSPNIRQTQSRG